MSAAENYAVEADGRLAGISAMPSMHVASSVLMALYASTHARWAGWAMWTFAALIMIGSVHLGWHYAIDGYFGAVIAWCAWVIGRRLAGVEATGEDMKRADL